MNNTELTFHEKLSVLLLMGIMIAIIVQASRPSAEQSLSKLLSYHETITEVIVTIEGAVARPGRYHVKIGSTLKDVLEEAKVLPEANLKKIRMDQKIDKPRHIKVPVQPKRKKNKNL